MSTYLVEIGVRDNKYNYPIPGLSTAPTTDKPAISEEYLQEVMMDIWLQSDSSTKQKRKKGNAAINTTNLGTESEEEIYQHTCYRVTTQIK